MDNQERQQNAPQQLGSTQTMYPPTDPANTASVWGSAGDTPKKKWTKTHTLIAAGVAVVVVAGGGAAVFAANQSHSTTAGNSQFAGPGSGGMGQDGQAQSDGQSGQSGQNSQGGMGGPGGMTGQSGSSGMAGMAAMAAALHSEYVVSENGSYVTMLGQTGEITAISSTELTLKSADGFTTKYALSSDTTYSQTTTSQSTQGGPPGGSTTSMNSSELAVGKTVRVTARKESASNPAQSVVLTTTTGSTN